jgi:hypothetical protein
VGGPEFVFGSGLIVLFWLFIALFVLAVLGVLALHVWAIIDVARTPDPVFGPPWDNTKSAWLAGLAIAFLITFMFPISSVVAVVLWWSQVRGPLQRGQPPQRPFWSSTPAYGPPGPYSYPPAPPGYGPPLPTPAPPASPQPPPAAPASEPEGRDG